MERKGARREQEGEDHGLRAHRRLSGQARDGPIYQAQPGFHRGYIIQTGAGEILAVSLWASPEQAEEGHRALGGWVRDHLAHAVLSAERRMGAVLSSVDANS